MVPSNSCLSYIGVVLCCLVGLAACTGMGEATNRLPQSLHRRVARQVSRDQILQQLSNSLYSDRVRRNHRHMSDAGYGSRIQAGSKLASSLIAQNIFGSSGPGRRKRVPQSSYWYYPLNYNFPDYR